MKIPIEILASAEKGGFLNGYDHNNREQAIICDPTFWQALGKSCGWGQQTWKAYVDGVNDTQWQLHAHRFYDLVLTGGDTEKFWESIISSVK